MDLAATCATHLAGKGVVRAGAIAAALLPQSTRGFLEGGSATHRTLMQNGSAKNFIDVCKLEITRLGTLENPVKDA
jgi:hypothetical protein